MKKIILAALALLPIAAVAFAAKSSISVEQIRSKNAFDSALMNAVAESWGQGGIGSKGRLG
ncbi:MAG: hypothetical protein AB7V08_09290 [Elusimicrobiales bacterium]